MDYISFVILHYKDIKVTDTCVQSILAMEQQERIRIVIVDNDIQKSEKDRKELSLKTVDFPMQTTRAINMQKNILEMDTLLC